MSRSGYSEDCDGWALIRWRGAVKSAIRGKRGQAFLREMLEALDAMPKKRLISDELEHQGEVCALGAVGLKRGLDMSKTNIEDSEAVGALFGIPHALAAEIEFMNDDEWSGWQKDAPEKRWAKMRAWVVRQLETPGAD